MLEIHEYSLNDVPAHVARYWEHMIDTCGYHPSLGSGWLQAIAESSGMTDQLRVLVALDRGAIQGLMPYYRQTVRMYGISLTALTVAGNLLSYHQEILSSGNLVRSLRALLSDKKTEGWDVIQIANVPRGGVTATAVNKLCSDGLGTLVKYEGEASPYLSIDGDWEQFLFSKSSSFRYKWKRKAKSLTNAGVSSTKWFTSCPQTEELLDAIMSIETKSWKAGTGMAITDRLSEQRYYSRLLPFLVQKEKLFANVLYLATTPIAYSLGYLWNGVVGQLKTSFNNEYAHISPGAIVTKAAIERAFSVRAKEFDFLGPSMEHKLEWTDQTRAHDDYFLFSNRLSARLVGTMKRVIQELRSVRANGGRSTQDEVSS